LKENLKTHGDLARLSRKLATIHTDVPVHCQLKDFSLSPPDLKSLREIFKELEFNKLIKDSLKKRVPCPRQGTIVWSSIRMNSSPY